ncbi:unnamed protein product [Orchesella dallaii]|uniref:TERF2-interacting telomeric protein 1 Myb domain-containing protein n=1 Tax=Orchesella dallaii TaxID=48710 RepID=A0ABP1Q0B1_9HEXA
MADDLDTVTLPPTPEKTKSHPDPGFKISSQTFMTLHADKENYQWKFQILPLTRREKFAFCSVYDKLSECIRTGGGLVIHNGSEEEKGFTIKILDLDYTRENIYIPSVQEMLLPYDCFSSNFIWSQIYQRLNDGSVGNVDLNAYRITPSAYREFDANAVLKGLKSWTMIPSLPPEKLCSPVSLKRVALFMFSDLLLQHPAMQPKRRVYSRKDSQLLLDTVCELNGHHRVNGRNLYKEIASEHVINRSWSSLREHFRKTILPHVLENDGYYHLMPSDAARFQKVLHVDRSSSKNKKK